ncbi:MAG: formylmethanofuran dehydrogenase subunit E family protein [Candidatus Omnitrophica bacterium]|nr:formylmethanofuran dehydrogenase subunit E family protein [Candidatus Omnitrophota bacterium]
MKINKELQEAIRFHGHLGPYLVLGLLAGELALKKLGCKKYFGSEVAVWGANKKPKSCIVDGLQLSTGATYGKGNIRKFNAKDIRIVVCDLKNKKKIRLSLKAGLLERLGGLKGHSDSEAFALRLFKSRPQDLFESRL